MHVLSSLTETRYHQDVNEWNFGKLSALREIQLAKEEDYGYYYMGGPPAPGSCMNHYLRKQGYYIHSCIKMRYKAAYRPQFVLGEPAKMTANMDDRKADVILLDPETYTWDPLDGDLVARLSLRRYVSMSKERDLGIAAEPLSTQINHVTQLLQGSAQLSRPPREQESETSKAFSDYVRAQHNPLLSQVDHSSIFEAGTPGALTLKEVEQNIALGGWRLRVRGNTVQLQVSTPTALVIPQQICRRYQFPLSKVLQFVKSSLTDSSGSC